MLSYDTEDGVVNRAFARFSENVPAWVWLLWVPQLLSSLIRAEGATMKTILCKIARIYPQAVYYTVRAYLIEKRENRVHAAAAQPTKAAAAQAAATAAAAAAAAATAATAATAAAAAAVVAAAKAKIEVKSESGETDKDKKTTSTDGDGDKKKEKESTGESAEATAAAVAKAEAEAAAARSATAAAAAAAARATPNDVRWMEEIVGVLRRSHSSLMTEVERMIDEFSRRFKPEPEEELLGAVHALILKCFKQPLTVADEVPLTLATTIDRVARKFFSPGPSSNNKKHLAFVYKYKVSFERDFLPPLALLST
jgi:transformation/transcription domain-associated protein